MMMSSTSTAAGVVLGGALLRRMAQQHVYETGMHVWRSGCWRAVLARNACTQRPSVSGNAPASARLHMTASTTSHAAATATARALPSWSLVPLLERGGDWGVGALHEHIARRRMSGSAADAASSQRDAEAEESGDVVYLSDGCVQRLQELGAEDGSAHSLLRVAVDGGGCSGFQYTFSLISRHELMPDDREFSRGGVGVVVDNLSLGFLKGATIDYTEELIKSSFAIVDNPNTEASCGCGASFAPK